MSNSAILYVITDLDVGGVPLHLRRLACAMRNRGFEPQVVSLAGIGPIGERLRKDGIQVDACRACCGWDVRVIFRLARIMRRMNPDIVHSLLFHANLAARLATRRAEVPVDRLLCEIQTVEVERSWHLTLDRWTHRRCRWTIGNSQAVVDHLAIKARIPRQRLKLVPGGIDPAPLREAVPTERSTLGIPDHARIVLWVGRLDPVKGLDVLVRAFETVTKQIDVHLLLAGDGPLRGELNTQIEACSTPDRIHLLGSRDDVPELLRCADAFAFPSRTEGLPNALLEAMAAGCPIVTTDVPGCRDLIRNDDTGLLVPYGDTAALSQALSKLLTRRDTATRLGSNAQQSVSENWHFDRTLDAYESLYRKVLGEQTKP